jgi:hypothetical protein
MFSSRSLGGSRFHVGDHLVGAFEGAEGSAGLDVRQAFGEPGINDASLLRRVFIVRRRLFPR